MLISTMLPPALFAFSFFLFFTFLSPPSECSNPALLWNSKTNCTSLLSITLGFTLWLDELLHSIHTPHAALRNSKTNCTCLLSTTLGLTLLLDEVFTHHSCANSECNSKDPDTFFTTLLNHQFYGLNKG